MAAILKICKLTLFPGSDDPRLFSGTHHDPLKQLKQKMLCCNFWVVQAYIDPTIRRSVRHTSEPESCQKLKTVWPIATPAVHDKNTFSFVTDDVILVPVPCVNVNMTS